MTDHQLISNSLTSAPWRRIAMVAVLATGVVVATSLAIPAPDDAPAPSLDTTRTTLEKWVETRKLISSERREMRLGLELLGERKELVEMQIKSIRASTQEQLDQVAESTEKFETLTEQNGELNEATASLEERIVELEARTRALLAKMPKLVQERVSDFSKLLPEDAEKAKERGLSQRYQAVIAVLTNINKFNREITVDNETRTMADGTTVNVRTLYIGIGQAYYVSGNGAYAGIGTMGADGWTWTPSNESAERIARAIRIFENEEVAAFVQLPLRIE